MALKVGEIYRLAANPKTAKGGGTLFHPSVNLVQLVHLPSKFYPMDVQVRAVNGERGRIGTAVLEGIGATQFVSVACLAPLQATGGRALKRGDVVNILPGARDTPGNLVSFHPSVSAFEVLAVPTGFGVDEDFSVRALDGADAGVTRAVSPRYITPWRPAAPVHTEEATVTYASTPAATPLKKGDIRRLPPRVTLVKVINPTVIGGAVNVQAMDGTSGRHPISGRVTLGVGAFQYVPVKDLLFTTDTIDTEETDEMAPTTYDLDVQRVKEDLAAHRAKLEAAHDALIASAEKYLAKCEQYPAKLGAWYIEVGTALGLGELVADARGNVTRWADRNREDPIPARPDYVSVATAKQALVTAKEEKVAQLAIQDDHLRFVSTIGTAHTTVSRDTYEQWFLDIPDVDVA